MGQVDGTASDYRRRRLGVLSRVSQAENMNLAEIARRFVETGELPDEPGSCSA
jgi:hypothetical protein